MTAPTPAPNDQRQARRQTTGGDDANVSRTPLAVGENCQYYCGKYPNGKTTLQINSLRTIFSLSIVVACSLAVRCDAHDRHEAGAKRHQPPAIYSYSASELGVSPLSSHRLNKPYSWNNHRLAKLVMDTDAASGDSEESRAAAFAGDNLMMGDFGDQGDYSLLYSQHQQRKLTTSPANRWPSRGNRRRRPSKSGAGGTKRVSASRPATKTAARPSRPSTKGWAAPVPPLDAPAANETSKRLAPAQRKNLVCYYGTWAVYRPDGGKFAVEDIDPFLCTHVIYGFTGLSYDNLIKPLDPWNDLEDNYGKGAMKRFTNLKRLNPDLKTLVAIGGWNEGSIKYSKMAADPAARAKFVESVMQFLTKYNFDGLDLDWEYPGSRGGSPSDKQNFVKLLRELHEAFRPRQYLLTAAVSAGKWFIDPAYDIPAVSKYLDLINLMAYDYHGGWETKTGHNAPLFSSPKHDLSREEQMLNVNWSVNYWLQMGGQREKIMLGVGSYGRSFTLDKSQVNGVNAPASQKGQAGPYTREPGSLGYNELCEAFKRSPQSWTIVRDADYLAPYAYNRERQWVGYDDQESLALKAQFAKSMGLGGMMMWSIETDDFRGSCHGEKFPLLNTIRRVMDGSGGSVGPASTTSRPPKPASATTRRPAPPVAATSTTTTTQRPGASSRRPGGEVEEDQRPPATSSTTSSTTSRRPNSSARPRPAQPNRPTTAKPPSTSAPPPAASSTRRPVSLEFTCREAGMFAEPQNCRKFVRCVQMGSQIQRYTFDCPPGTAFNEPQQYCDHLYNVPQCKADGSSSGNKWPATNEAAEVESGEVSTVARASLSGAHPADNYPAAQVVIGSAGEPLIPLIAVAGHHFPHQFGPYLGADQLQQRTRPQQPLIVQWR